MIAFGKANKYFEQLNTCLLGLSIDSNPSHLAWMYDIYCKTGTILPFPIIADRNGEIARKYGMISNNISNTSTVRNVFVIDDKQIVRAILVYPMNIGRNIPEILRIVKALQTADANGQMAPVNWMPCEPMVVPMPQTFKELQCRLQQIEQNKNGMSWYLSFKNPANCQINEMQNDNCSRITDANYTNDRGATYNLMASNNYPNNRELEKDFESSEQNRSLNNNVEKDPNNKQTLNSTKIPEKKNSTIQWKKF